MNLTNFQLAIIEKAAETRGAGGLSTKSCKRHLERAWALMDSMPEVAVFLAITAEEEAATALFHAFRKRKYEGIGKIKIRNHMHKAGVYPFIRLLGESFLPKDVKVDITMYFDAQLSNKKCEILRIRMPLFEQDGEHICLVPEPPLGFVSVEAGGKSRDYRKEVKEVATNSGISSIFKYIRDISNVRNKMLYASDSAIPKVENAKQTINRHANAVVLILIFYLLIEPHGKQTLPQEALNAYIGILGNLESEAT